MKELKSYLWQQWSHCNMPKYYKHFKQWFNNLTSNQIEYLTAYANGQKTPLTHGESI